jgi:inner membrane protein
MASAFTHAFFSLAMGKTFIPKEIPLRFWGVSILCSTLPDIDIFGSRLGLGFGGFWGHRGFFHSLLFAFFLSLLAWYFASRDTAFSGSFGKSSWKLWVFYFLLSSSHGLLDAITNGGSGVAFFSPFDSTRYFFPWRPVMVSPIGWRGFFSSWGARVIVNEMTWIWIPSLLLLGAVEAARRLFPRRDLRRAERVEI